MAMPFDIDADSWPLYAQTRDRFIDLARSSTAEQAATTVPLSPGWTVAQVLAHVCGLNGDLADGLREGLGTAARTAHQVDSRAGRSVDEVCDEWLQHGPVVEAIIGRHPFLGRRLAADLVIHLHDVHHALGRPVDRDDEATISGGQTYATHTVDRWLEAKGIAVTIDLTDGGPFEPSAAVSPTTPRVTLRASAYDFLRSVSGRRSRAQVEALDWSADPGALIDGFSPYGQLRDTDAPI